MISNKMRDVRVTARRATPRDFIAPELSPVRTIDQEIEKGTKGWTDFDVKCPDMSTDHLPKGLREQRIEDLKLGVTLRKAPANEARVRRPRPSVRRWA